MKWFDWFYLFWAFLILLLATIKVLEFEGEVTALLATIVSYMFVIRTYSKE